MKHKYKFLKALLLSFLLLATQCVKVLYAEVLGTATYECSWYCNVESGEYNYQEIKFELLIGWWSDGGQSGSCHVTWDAWLDSTHVDTVLIATSESENFDCLVGNITDGVTRYDEYLAVGFLMQNPSGETYGCQFGCHVQDCFSLDTVDFAAATITQIKLIVDEIGVKHYEGKEKLSPYWTVRLVVEGSWNNTAVESRSWGKIKAIYKE